MSDDVDAATKKDAAGGKGGKKNLGRVTVTPERCKGCGYCVAFCPTAVLLMSSAFNAKGYHVPEIVDLSACTGCDLCGMYCPDFAIAGARNPKSKPDKEPS